MNDFVEVLEKEPETVNPVVQQDPGQSHINRAKTLLLEGLELDESNQQVFKWNHT